MFCMRVNLQLQAPIKTHSLFSQVSIHNRTLSVVSKCVSKTTAIMSLTNPLFVLIADVSHITRTTDLQSCGETTVLVKRVGSFVTDNEE